MKKKSTLVMVANLQGTPQDRYNLQGSGLIKLRRPRTRMVMGGIKFPNIPKVKKGDKRNIYA
jgi:hypothetical protein